jgi:hypothetical protein
VVNDLSLVYNLKLFTRIKSVPARKKTCVSNVVNLFACAYQSFNQLIDPERDQNFRKIDHCVFMVIL